MTQINIINLPTEIYTVIENFANIKINTKWVKSKKELRIKTIKHKCGACKRDTLQFRQMRIFGGTYYNHIVDVCKNADNCSKYCVSNNIDWMGNLEEHKEYCHNNRATEIWGYNFKNEINKKMVIRNLQRLFTKMRYHYDEKKQSYHTGYVYNNINTSKSFFHNHVEFHKFSKEQRLDKLVKLTKLTDSIRRIDGNGILIESQDI